MISKKIQDLVACGDGLFSNKASLDSFLDSIALEFYPERAYVINNYTRTDGAFYASNLTTSFPILIRRALGEVFSSTRPKHENWFEAVTGNYDDLGNDSRKWLETASKVQRSFVYDTNSGFVTATSQADQDFATFGQAVISIEPDWRTKNLVHRCWRLRDVAWQDDYAGNTNQVFRKCSLRLIDIYKLFGDKCAPQMKIDMVTSPYKFQQIYHLVMTKFDYENSYKDDSNQKFNIDQPFVSIYLDVKNQHLLSITPVPTLRYVIPTWVKVAGSQYAYSPSVMTALPDANLLQAMTLTILDAAEKGASPPILAREDAVRGDIGLSANAVTVINGNYDGKIEEAIQMMNIDRSGVQLALAMMKDTQEMIKQAFYINKIELRSPSEAMTAYEVSQIVKQNVRQLLSLFQPIEEMNSKLCETQFFELLHAGAFGNPRDLPEELQNQDVIFKFKNPLVEAQGDNKVQLFTQVQAAIAQTAPLDPSVSNIVDIKTAFRDALYAGGTPAKWLRSEEVVAEIDQQQAQQAQAQQLIQQLQAGGQAAESVGKGAQAVQQAGLIQQ